VRTAAVLFSALVGLAACQREPPPAPRTVRGVALVSEHGEPLPRLAGELLHPLMRIHADDVAAIRHAMAARAYDRLAAAAGALAREPRLARPSPAIRDTVNESLPPEFFDLQDRMLIAARDLETAAGDRDDAAIEHAFADLRSTCVSCHALYRRSRR
jgi:hypothetical protein